MLPIIVTFFFPVLVGSAVAVAWSRRYERVVLGVAILNSIISYYGILIVDSWQWAIIHANDRPFPYGWLTTVFFLRPIDGFRLTWIFVIPAFAIGCWFTTMFFGSFSQRHRRDGEATLKVTAGWQSVILWVGVSLASYVLVAVVYFFCLRSFVDTPDFDSDNSKSVRVYFKNLEDIDIEDSQYTMALDSQNRMVIQGWMRISESSCQQLLNKYAWLEVEGTQNLESIAFNRTFLANSRFTKAFCYIDDKSTEKVMFFEVYDAQ